MANQKWTDPALTQGTMNASDVLLFLRTAATGCGDTSSGFNAANITAQNFSLSILLMGLAQLGPLLPDTAPSGGGWWLNNGALSYSLVSGSSSGTPLTAEALSESLKALLAAAPSMGDTWNFNGFQNNAGVVTEVDDGNSGATSGPSSSTVLTPAAFTESLKQALAAYPAMGSIKNFNGFQNNAGVATEVDDGT